jgi:lipoprotein NlpI
MMLAGCASHDPEAEVDFTNATINQKPAALIMDTGSDSSLIFRPSHVGLTPAQAAHDWPVNGQTMDIFALSNPANITFGPQTVTAPLSVMNLPWFIRWVTAFLGSDGLISWAEVQDNILVFDAEKHVVRAVAELPPETAGWLQLKVRRTGPLTLEVPLADGSTGTILVDTGQPYGVSLPPKQWEAWHAEHPQAPSAMRTYAMIGSDIAYVRDAWADEIQLGSLTITDVPVHEAIGVESDGDPFHYAGTLGMYALTRVDLIVDGKNGVAYLHPKPPPGPAYPGITRLNAPKNLPDGDSKWTVDASVRVQSDNFWLVSAGVKVSDKDYDDAEADIDRAFAANPNNPSAYDARGDIKLTRGDTAGALADYDRAVALDPMGAGFYNDRGFAKYAAGDLAGAASDLDESLAMAPEDANAYVNRGDVMQSRGDFLDALTEYQSASAWQPGGWPDVGDAYLRRELLRRQLGLPAADMSKTVADWGDSWVKSVGLFVSGKLSEAALLAAATKGDPPGSPANAATLREQQCAAEYYIGMMRLLGGDAAGAREHWQKCVADGCLDLNEVALARAELALTDNSAPAPSQVQILFSGSKKYAAGDYAGAITDFTQAIAADSKNGYAYHYRGLARFEQDDRAGAIADLTEAVALEPKNFFAYEQRGEARDSQGDHAGALADYAQSLKLDPQKATVDADDEYDLERQGDYAGAIALHTKGIATDAKAEIPDDYADRARAKEMQGDFAGALADYEQAIALQPGGMPNSQLHRQLVQRRLGQTPPDISKAVAGWKDPWEKSLGLYVLGKSDENALLAAANSDGEEAAPLLLCQADYYIGVMHLLQGDQAGARAFWKKCLASNLLNDDSYQLARAELARLDSAVAAPAAGT